MWARFTMRWLAVTTGSQSSRMKRVGRRLLRLWTRLREDRLARLCLRSHVQSLSPAREHTGAQPRARHEWLQGTYTQRFNARHQVCGRLFQGRHKALIMDSEDVGYVQLVSTYIHLNPVRAGLVPEGGNQLRRYQWSSYPLHLAGQCPV